MTPYCAELTLDIYPLKNNFNPFDLPRIFHQSLDVETYANPEILKLLNAKGVYISFIEAFSYWRPYESAHIHIDTNDDVSKLNWIFGGGDSSNQWFQIKSQAQGTKAVTQANTGSVRYSISEIEKLLFTYPAKKNPFIFQAGIPHKSCIGKEKRCCISMVLNWTDTNQRLTFQEAVDILSDYLI
jgi:hypothetical protein